MFRILRWMIYSIYAVLLFGLRWMFYNFFPMVCLNCSKYRLTYFRYYSLLYKWDIDKNFKPVTEKDKTPCDFLICECCEKYINLDEK
jgi:hypothetical protein